MHYKNTSHFPHYVQKHLTHSQQMLVALKFCRRKTCRGFLHGSPWNSTGPCKARDP